MVKLEPVSIGWQTAFMFIPYLWIFAFYRIQKLRMGIVLALISIVINIGIEMVLPFPYNYAVAVVVTILLPVRFIRKWSREWNQKVSHST